MSASLVRSAVIELVRIALEGSPARRGAALELVRVADGERVESEPLALLKAALALVGGANG